VNEYETPRQHREHLIDTFTEAYREKYDKGQQEHGGQLWKKDTTGFMLEEVLDFWSYAKVATDQRDEAIAILEVVMRGSNRTEPAALFVLVQRALDILRGTEQDNK